MKIEDVIEKVFTSKNPETGGEPPENLAWVIFENGTVFLAAPSEQTPLEIDFEPLAEVASQELKVLGPSIGGTPSGDFNVIKLGWYPDDFVYRVTYNHPNIANIEVCETETDHLLVGISGRAARGKDAENLQVKFVRKFDGSTKVME